MSNIVDLSVERAEREDDNTKVSVECLMKMVLGDIANGKLALSTKAFLCVVVEIETCEELRGYRCGLTKAEELGYIEAFKLMTFKGWEGA